MDFVPTANFWVCLGFFTQLYHRTWHLKRIGKLKIRLAELVSRLKEMCGKLSSILNQFHIEAFFVHIIKAVQYIISEHVSENPINDCKIVFQMNFFITKIAALMPSPFAWTKYFLPRQKIFPRLKNSHLLVKWMENDFLAMDKIFSTAKKSFPILFPCRYETFSLGQNFLSTQKIFCPGRWTRN